MPHRFPPFSRRFHRRFLPVFLRFSGFCFSVFLTVGTFALPVRADDWQPDKGFISLYNGADLSGWQYADDDRFDGKTQSSDGRYTAKGETIVVHPQDPAKGPRLRQMWTQQKFPDDFVLKLQFRAAENADSGVFLRRPQLQCRDYLVAGPYKNLKNYRPQDWNEIVVTVTGGVARCECNGEVLQEALKLPETGPIGLEADRGQMEYRHIQITKPKAN